jgi:hypothetical protein
MTSIGSPSRPRQPSASMVEAFMKASVDLGVTGYPGALKIRKAEKLTPDQRAVEARFAAQIEADPEYFFSKYLTDYGEVLNTDNARELSADYNESHRSRAEHAASVQEPAGAIVKELWKRLLQQDDPEGNNVVLFLAGGGGSGKTRATESPGVKEFKDEAQIIYDTTMANTSSSIRKVEEALDAGKSVAVLYIHRPVELAVRGVIQRAVSEGRVVPAEVLAHDHFYAQETFLELADRYRDEAGVLLAVLDNSKDGLPAEETSIDFIRQNRYDSVAGVQRRIEEVIDDEYERRKGTKSALPDYAYQALRG